jgi:hypothetical protein
MLPSHVRDASILTLPTRENHSLRASETLRLQPEYAIQRGN